jgi:anthranilate phosphoribosyltransferase
MQLPMTISPVSASRAEGARPNLAELLARITAGGHLTASEAEGLFARFMDGSATPVQMAAVLVALRAKGAAPAEVAGGVRALRGAMLAVEAEDPDELVDTCGTGGGRVTTFNLSTAAAFVAAGAGVRVAKHGNRSFTSMCGSADVLEALGIRIELGPDEMARVLDSAGIVFMFAPLLHPAMRHVGPVRRELGIPTVMNVLGPLTNPAGARRQVVGVADPELVPLLVEALRELGHLRALVVHGLSGMDEITPGGPTRVAELNEGVVREYEVTPEGLGLPSGAEAELAGGAPDENARIILSVLSGERSGAVRTATALNAGAAIYVSGRAETLEAGVRAAEASLDSGAAIAKLEALRDASLA